MSKIYFIDPLKIRVIDLLTKREYDPLNIGRQKFGSQKDLFILEKELTFIKPRSTDFVLIDFTPFSIEAISDVIKLNRLLVRFSELKIAILSFSKEFEKIYHITCRNKSIPFLIINSDGKMGTISENKHYSKYQGLNNTILNHTIKDLRDEFSNKKLVGFLHEIPEALETPNNNTTFPIRKHKGKKYLLMNNKMLVTCYIRPKEFGLSNSILFFIAYEIILRMLDFFLPKSFDEEILRDTKIVVVNNTSLYFASIVQSILEIELIVIDRLGPVPILCPPLDKIKEMLERSKIILIQEVVATGGETDRAIMFLNQALAEIKTIINIYNLEAGVPKLLGDISITSLCKPKKKLKYEYTSY